MSHISYFVPMIPQGQNPTCWVSCAAMVLSWKTRSTLTYPQILTQLGRGGDDPSNESIPNPQTDFPACYGQTGLDRRMDLLLAKLGFVPAERSITSGSIEWLLRAHGPLIVISYLKANARSGDPDSFFYVASYHSVCIEGLGFHAMVLNGINTNVRPNTVEITNPWGERYPRVNITSVTQALEETAQSAENAHAVYYLP